MREIRIPVSPRIGEVSGLVVRPPDATAFLLLAHGAGAGMRHAFMESLAEVLAAAQIATLRYQFPYVEKGSGRPDPPAVLTATVRAAAGLAAEEAKGLPLFAGGKSMGGRMTSTAQSEAPLPEMKGLVFFGFPLHQAGKPGASRADHLKAVHVPMLFLQGTRDALADLDYLQPVLAPLETYATLHVLEGADHSFHVLKRSGRNDAEVMAEMVGTVRGWMSARA